MQPEKQNKSVKIRIPLRSMDSEMIRDLQEKYPEAEVSVEIHPNRGHSPMSESYFWEIIGMLDWSAEKDDQQILEPAVRHLAGGPVRHIFEFADLLSEKLFSLDGVTFARAIGTDSWSPDQYFSVDNFLYARTCVIANGKTFYEQVRQDPTQMPKDLTFEALLHLPSLAYERKTAHPYDYIPAYPVETYSNKEGWNLAITPTK